MPADPTALLIIRAWLEDGSAVPLRAHIRQTLDVSQGFEHATTAADVDAIVEVVRRWLEQIVVA